MSAQPQRAGAGHAMKVLAISSAARLGGAELSLLEILRRRPDYAETYVLVMGEGALASRLRGESLPTWVARGFDARPSAAGAVAFSRSLSRLLARVRPDVVLACGLKAAVLAVPAARAASTPIVWQKVDFSRDAQLALPLSLAVDGVIAVSEAAAQALGPARQRRLLDVIGPPIRLADMPYAEPARAEAPTIGTLATFLPYKGLDRVLRAAALLSPEFPDLRVVLAGGEAAERPGYSAELGELVTRLGLTGRVELPGFVEDISKLLGRLHVYVNATYRDRHGFGMEGLSAGMLEASWVGRPIVATRGGGTGEGVLDGITGTLVEAGDDAALAGAIGAFLRDPECARAAGQAGRRFARERFAADVVSGRVFAALARIASD